MMTFNRSRCFFNCPPDCPGRKPGCQDHCKTYLDKRAELDALNAKERKRKEAAVYTIEAIADKKDQQAKRKRSLPSHKVHP